MRAWSLGRAAADALERRWVRRAGVADGDRVPRVAATWSAIAIALAVGGVLDGAWRTLAVIGLVGVAATRPSAAGHWTGPRNGDRRSWRTAWLTTLGAIVSGRRAVFWIVLAAALVAAGARVDAIDRSAECGGPRTVEGEIASLHEPLPATRPGGPGGRARATLGGREIELLTPRFGAGTRPLPRGAAVRVSGRFVTLDASRPADARLRRGGVCGRLLPSAVAWDGARRGGGAGAIDRFASRAEQAFVASLGTRRGSLVTGMALGASDGIAEPEADALRTSGLWHLVAASGGNIALVIALVMALGWAVGAGDRMRLAFAAVAVCLYVPLAGAGPSIQRAGVMGLAALLALALGREHRAATALAVAAAATLGVDPRAWLDVGWQLSFAAAAGLIAAAAPVARRLARTGLPRWLAAGLACTVVATVATAPVMLAVFGELSLIGLVTNALVLPLVGVVVWSGTLAALLSAFAPGAVSAVLVPAGLAAELTLDIAAWGSTRAHATLAPIEVAALIAAVALVAVVRPPPFVVRVLVVAAIGWLAWAVPRPPGEPRLVVLDIGQGNATLLQDGRDGVLVDAGPIDGGVVAALRRTGVRRLRAVLLSHPAADHDGGAAAAIDAFPTDLVLDGGDRGGGPTHAAAMAAARRRGAAVAPARAGQRLAFGRITLRLRWPTPPAVRRAADPNDRAAVVEARIGRLRALLPADAEGNVLTTIPNLLPADVLIVSHHGSADAALPAVLRRVRPRVAVVSSGEHNTYGHPTPSTLATLQAARTPTLRTDQAGTIDLRAGDDGGVEVRRGP